MAHKYLKELGIANKDLPWNWQPKDERHAEWKESRKVYGFDERDTWSLKYTLALLVYERLKWFREYAPVVLDDPNWCMHAFEGKPILESEAIDRILRGFEMYLKNDDGTFSDDDYKEYRKCWELLGVIIHRLWW